MELKDILSTYGIIGVISSYEMKEHNGKISELPIRMKEKAMKIVGLDDQILEKEYSDLSVSEKFKIDLATKLDNEIIVVGNLSKNLIGKDMNFIKKLLIKLNKNYNKKIVVIDNNINSFMNLAKHIVVIKDKKVIFESNNSFDKELYNYISKPPIVDFIEYVNKDKRVLNETTDIYELIKYIYRVVS